jgi:hypothetical protein
MTRVLSSVVSGTSVPSGGGVVLVGTRMLSGQSEARTTW